MADEKNQQAAAAADAGTVTLERVSTPPAQTWNYLRVNDIALDVPTPTAPAEKYDGALADLETVSYTHLTLPTILLV